MGHQLAHLFLPRRPVTARLSACGGLIVLGLIGVALGQAPTPLDAPAPPAWSLVLDASLALSQPEPPAAAPGSDDPADEPRELFHEGDRSMEFGRAGSWTWGLTSGVAFHSDSTDAQLQFHVGTFFTDRFEFLLGASGWYYAQDGRDAGGINPAFAFRYHFLMREDWSVYAETGIGLVFSTDDVPEDGTSINFTPRAGVGATVRLGESAARLDVGVRWQHVSNGSVQGSDDNPSRDSPMIYLGVLFPF